MGANQAPWITQWLHLEGVIELEIPSNFDDIFDEAVPTPKEELRGSRAALPADVYFYLNDIQRIAMQSLQNFGWHLAFIRRPLFMAPVVVVRNSEQTKLAVLEEDGTVNMNPRVRWRS